MKNVPGKKTDMRDSKWISTLLRAGLLNGSFIPDKRIREFRHLNRYRKSIIHDITSQKNRIEKMLMSVNGTLSKHQRSFLGILMNHYDSLKEHLSEIETALEEDMKPFTAQVKQLRSIYGIGTTASCAIIAEIGIDMPPFKTAEHICSWAGLCPGNHESAGKRKSTSVTKGNPYIKSMLCEISRVITSKRNTYLSAWYWRIKQKKGAKKAIIALARKLLVIIYTMLKQGTMFDETFFEIKRKNCESKKLSRYIRELERHGYHVETSN